MKKITKIFTYFVLMILLVSGCSCKKDKDNKVTVDSNQLNCFADFIYTKVCFVFVKLAQDTDLIAFLCE